VKVHVKDKRITRPTEYIKNTTPSARIATNNANLW